MYKVDADKMLSKAVKADDFRARQYFEGLDSDDYTAAMPWMLTSTAHECILLQ